MKKSEKTKLIKEINMITEHLRRQSNNHSSLELRVQILEAHVKHLRGKVGNANKTNN